MHEKVSGFRNRYMGSKTDVFLGARIRVNNDDSGKQYREGIVVAVEQMLGPDGTGECLRVLVDTEVGQESGNYQTGKSAVMVVDTSIPMHRVHLSLGSRLN